MDNTLNILAHASEAICAVNDEKRVVYWNAAAEALLGSWASRPMKPMVNLVGK
jgi:PAS domain-containing protein